MADYAIAGLERFRFWCQKVLPAVYDDSLTYYELLCKAINKLNELIDKDNEQSDVINVIIDELEELRELYDNFVQGDLSEYYVKLLEKWLHDNMDVIFDMYVKQVYFGLNEQGYFVAYIPDSWDDIVFDTGMQYGIDTYGRLILRWDVDASGETVNQRPEDWS